MKSSLLLALIRAQVEGDSDTFKKLTLQIAAKEASAGHTRVAKEIRELIDQISHHKPVGQYVDKPDPVIPIARPNGELATLLHASYPKERLRDMVLDEELKKLLERILDEQHYRQKFASYGLAARRKFLLVGPPGCGKTMTAKMLAGELGIPLFVVRLEGLLSRYLGETSAHLSAIFDAMKNTTGVYLFDEFDSIGTFRGDTRDIGEVRRVLSTFLQLIENDSSDSIIVAATNYEHVLDDALFRRFDDVIEFSPPSIQLICEFLRKNLQIVPKEQKNFPWKVAAEKSVGLSFAEIARACADAIKAMLISGRESLPFEFLDKSIEERLAVHKRINKRR